MKNIKTLVYFLNIPESLTVIEERGWNYLFCPTSKNDQNKTVFRMKVMYRLLPSICILLPEGREEDRSGRWGSFTGSCVLSLAPTLLSLHLMFIFLPDLHHSHIRPKVYTFKLTMTDRVFIIYHLCHTYHRLVSHFQTLLMNHTYG